MPIWTIENGVNNARLIDYLQQKIPLAPAAYLRQLLRRGKVVCNGSGVTEETPVNSGDRLALPENRKLLDFIEQGRKLPVVLFENDTLLVVAKPAGLAVHTGQGHEVDNLVQRVAMLGASRRLKFSMAPVHRLDLETSGPVLFGKGKKALAAYGQLMQENTIGKSYLALTTAGLPRQCLLDKPVPGKGKIKHAETTCRVVTENAAFALLELTLRTGRQHQIRRQLADSGHPIVGDRRYGGPMIAGFDRLFLHCRLLELTDPFSGQQISIRVPLPNELVDILNRCGFDDVIRA